MSRFAFCFEDVNWAARRGLRPRPEGEELHSPPRACRRCGRSPGSSTRTRRGRCMSGASRAGAGPGLCRRSCTGRRGCGCPPGPAWRTPCEPAGAPGTGGSYGRYWIGLDWIHFIVIVQTLQSTTKWGFVTNRKCKGAVKCSLYMNYQRIII